MIQIWNYNLFLKIVLFSVVYWNSSEKLEAENVIEIATFSYYVHQCLSLSSFQYPFLAVSIKTQTFPRTANSDTKKIFPCDLFSFTSYNKIVCNGAMEISVLDPIQCELFLHVLICIYTRYIRWIGFDKWTTMRQETCSMRK